MITRRILVRLRSSPQGSFDRTLLNTTIRQLYLSKGVLNYSWKSEISPSLPTLIMGKQRSSMPYSRLGELLPNMNLWKHASWTRTLKKRNVALPSMQKMALSPRKARRSILWILRDIRTLDRKWNAFSEPLMRRFSLWTPKKVPCHRRSLCCQSP